ncbi:MAG: RuvX/YqgF family protein [Rickettsiales bacterium]|jgi:putative Holliday junction resolvase|nr:RuvX/YqgF family protein [Rickettsiales bacterium]
MICKDFNFFPKAGKLLGVDWGARRVGIAVSSPDRDFVFLRPRANDARQVADTARSENAAGIVLGLPLFFDGSESETTKKVRAFAKDLAALTDIPIILFDETLTSAEAAERGAKPNDLDSESARVLLENAISFMERVVSDSGQ